ncbi:ribonucleotide-diphosphate reductase subunit beta [Streptomyces sp. CA-111067]|jgi:ribonucleoside-diphosphate reductase beta chain|uniref:ribonucleotide-diphosphate reductase subunit beta n=1 Tax=Streptomyces sp. CA-111067 TaxID=3240046 RepID=UPI003D98B9A2
MTATPAGLVLDVTETAPETSAEQHGRLAGSADLYRRWERQQWAVAQVNPARDAPVWNALSKFSRDQMLGSLAELEVGEVAVTHTLGSLIDAPPTEDDRIFLCTQLADEARHVRFFQTYLEDGCGVAMGEAAGAELEGSADYADVFAPELVRVTDAVRANHDDRDSWYRALTYYHLITEGVLAATALRTTRFLAKRLKLPALEEGLTNVTRDESRHVSFGLRAAQDGVVNGGFGQVVEDAHFESLGAAAWVLIGPSRFNPVPAIQVALISRAAQLSGAIEIARERLVKQLRLVGLPHLTEKAGLAWDQAVDRAIDAYEERWNAPHPIRAAAALTA